MTDVLLHHGAACGGYDTERTSPGPSLAYGGLAASSGVRTWYVYGGRAASQVPVATIQGLTFIVVAELTARSDLASYFRLAALAVVFSSCSLLP